MSITVDLPAEVTADITRRAKRAGKTPGEFIAEAVRRQLAIERFRETREKLAPYGKTAGLDTDDAVFAGIS